MKKWIWHVIGMVTGGLTIIAGIAVMASYAGVSPVMDINGMDFYTMMYQAAAYSAYNVLMLSRTVSMGCGVLLISLGLAEICFFGGRFMADWPEKKKAADPEDGPQMEGSAQPSLPGENGAESRAKLTGPTQTEMTEQDMTENENPIEDTDIAETAAPISEEEESVLSCGDSEAPADLLSEAAEAEQELQDAVADAESAIRQAAEAAAAVQEKDAPQE